MMGRLKLSVGAGSAPTKAQASATLARVNSEMFSLEEEQGRLRDEMPRRLIEHTGPGIGGQAQNARLEVIARELKQLGDASELLGQIIERHEAEERQARIDDACARARGAAAHVVKDAKSLQEILDAVVPKALALQLSLQQFASEIGTLPRSLQAQDFMAHELSANLGRLISVYLHAASDARIRSPGVFESPFELRKSGVADIVRRAKDHVTIGMRSIPPDDTPPAAPARAA